MPSGTMAQLVQEREHLSQQYRAYMQQNGNHFASMTNKSASDNGFLHLTNLFAASDKSPQHGEPGIVVSIHPNYAKPVTHDHSFFELICVIRGSCSNVSGYQDLTLQAGDILILAPGMKHAISVFDDDTFVMNILIDSATFEKTFFHIFSNYDILYIFFSNVLYNYAVDTFVHFRAHCDPIVMSLLYQLNELHLHPRDYSQHIRTACVSLLFAHLLANHTENAIVYNDDFSGVHTDVSNILRHIQQNFTSITLDELAEKFGYSNRQLLRILKFYTGKGFKEIIQYLRVQYAATLLVKTNESIESIAHACGYSSSRALRKLFQERYQLSPSAYRVNHHPQSSLSSHP